jgi:hypothetical protein
MSFYCTELWSARALTWGRSATRAALVVNTTTATAAIQDAIATLSAGVGASHPQDGRLYVADQGAIGVSNEGGPTTWRVTFNYTRKDGGAGAAGGDELLAKRTRWRWTPGTAGETTDNDLHGNVIANSAGSPFQPKAMREYPTLQLEAYRYVSRFDLPLALRFMGKNNSNGFTIAQFGRVEPGQVRCLFIGPTQDFIEVRDGEQPPVEICHRFEIRNAAVSGEFNDPGFKLRVLDKSRGGWALVDGKLTPGEFSTKTPTGGYVEVGEEILLDGTGKPIDPEIRIGTKAATVKTPVSGPTTFYGEDKKIGTDKGPKGATYRIFEVFESIDFSPLIAVL